MPKRLIVRGPGMRGPAGRDGSNTVPTDEAFAGLVEDATSDTRAALDALIGDGGNLGTAGYDIVLLLGQSNMQGETGGSVNTLVDITSPEIWTFGATGTYASQIVLASDPLAHRQGNAAVIGPGMEFARWYAPRTRRRVLLVPAAYSATGFTGTPNWDTASPDDSSSLYNLAIHQAEAALAAAGEGSRFAAALWVQGESDAVSGMTEATYRTHLEYVIDGLRDRLATPDLPFVIGSMLPEFIASYVGAPTRVAIDAVHRGTPARKAYSSFVDIGTGYDKGDGVHYGQAGERALGRAMVDGVTTAVANSTPANLQPVNPPDPPPEVTGSASDTFTRADSATLGTTETGGLTWAMLSGTMGVFSNTAKPGTVPTDGSMAVLDATSLGGTNLVYEFTIANHHAASTLIGWHVTDLNNQYVLGVSATPPQLWRKVGGVYTELTGHFVGAAAYANGDAWRIEINGSTFTFYRNGVPLGAVTDATLAHTKKVALYAASVNCQYDTVLLETTA